MRLKKYKSLDFKTIEEINKISNLKERNKFIYNYFMVKIFFDVHKKVLERMLEKDNKDFIKKMEEDIEKIINESSILNLDYKIYEIILTYRNKIKEFLEIITKINSTNNLLFKIKGKLKRINTKKYPFLQKLVQNIETKNILINKEILKINKYFHKFDHNLYEYFEFPEEY